MSRAVGLLAVADDDIGKAGPFGLFLILSLLVVVFFLGRSMRTHLRRVPLEFPESRPPAQDGQNAAPALDEGVIEGEIVDRPSNGHRPTAGDPHRPEKPRPG